MNNIATSFFKGIKSTNKNGLLKPNDEKSISVAINLAYGDAKRTMTKIANYSSEKEEAFKNLNEKFKNYFNNNAPANTESFNTAHKKLCEIWCNAFSKTSPDVIGTYGKAQKIVNMTFKYLYCCNNINGFDDHFKYCHMPLDSFTLEWYKRTICSKDIKNDMKWSSLDIQTYEKLSNKIYDYLLTAQQTLIDKNGNKVDLSQTPLIAEFIVWPTIQLHLAVESFYFSYNNTTNITDKRNFKKLTLADKLKEVKIKLP